MRFLKFDYSIDTLITACRNKWLLTTYGIQFVLAFRAYKTDYVQYDVP